MTVDKPHLNEEVILRKVSICSPRSISKMGRTRYPYAELTCVWHRSSPTFTPMPITPQGVNMQYTEYSPSMRTTQSMNKSLSATTPISV